jgi:site-specific DNA-methyltransferase (adenine-specific)
LPNHQTIFWFSKTKHFKFNPIFEDYSPSTNLDQILQLRARDKSNKSIYAKDENGELIVSGKKNGVPLSDVWDIPFLNPKAKERTGYPTQKPILLLERIIELCSNKGDLVLDPFFGSGTTLVAAKLLDRKFVGFDVSEDAFKLASERLEIPIKTESMLLKNGRESYREADEDLLKIIQGIKLLPVQRNNSIDAIIPGEFLTGPMLVKIQRNHETLSDVIFSLVKTAKKKGSKKSIVIKTHEDLFPFEGKIPKEIEVVPATGLVLKSIAEKLVENGEVLMNQLSQKGIAPIEKEKQ